jgi:hypothetical protein
MRHSFTVAAIGASDIHQEIDLDRVHRPVLASESARCAQSVLLEVRLSHRPTRWIVSRSSASSQHRHDHHDR